MPVHERPGMPKGSASEPRRIGVVSRTALVLAIEVFSMTNTTGAFTHGTDHVQGLVEVPIIRGAVPEKR